MAKQLCEQARLEVVVKYITAGSIRVPDTIAYIFPQLDIFSRRPPEEEEAEEAEEQRQNMQQQRQSTQTLRQVGV